jgi:hypothetical protein
MSKKTEYVLKQFSAEVNGQWVPLWAHNLDEALEVAEVTYGPQNVGRVRAVVEPLKETPSV